MTHIGFDINAARVLPCQHASLSPQSPLAGDGGEGPGGGSLWGVAGRVLAGEGLRMQILAVGSVVWPWGRENG